MKVFWRELCLAYIPLQTPPTIGKTYQFGLGGGGEGVENYLCKFSASINVQAPKHLLSSAHRFLSKNQLVFRFHIITSRSYNYDKGVGKLRNNAVKLRWWVVVGVGMRGFLWQIDFVDLVIVNYFQTWYSHFARSSPVSRSSPWGQYIQIHRDHRVWTARLTFAPQIL